MCTPPLTAGHMADARSWATAHMGVGPRAEIDAIATIVHVLSNTMFSIPLTIFISHCAGHFKVEKSGSVTATFSIHAKISCMHAR